MCRMCEMYTVLLGHWNALIFVFATVSYETFILILVVFVVLVKFGILVVLLVLLVLAVLAVLVMPIVIVVLWVLIVLVVLVVLLLLVVLGIFVELRFSYIFLYLPPHHLLFIYTNCSSYHIFSLISVLLPHITSSPTSYLHSLL